VLGAVKPGMTDAEAGAQRRAEMAAIEKACVAATGLKCEVITLYSGGEYWLYRNKKYTDLRLVFAPEEQIAYFGGDFDNFTYPRWNFDITFLPGLRERTAREDGALLQVVEGRRGGRRADLHPRLSGLDRAAADSGAAQVPAGHRQSHPEAGVDVAARRPRALCSARGRAGQEGVGRPLGLENSLKRLVGQQEGLMNPRIFAKKEEDEAALRAKVAAKPEWLKAYAPAWDQIAGAYAGLPAFAKRLAFSNLTASRLAGMASTIVRYGDEIQKPGAQRYPEFADARLDGLKFGLFSSAPVYADMEEAQLAAWLEEALLTLGAGDPFVQAALGGQTPAAVARQAIAARRWQTPPRARRSWRAGPPRLRCRRIRSSRWRGGSNRSSANCARGRKRRSRTWRRARARKSPRRASPPTASPCILTPTSTCVSSTAPCSATRRTRRSCPSRPRSSDCTSGRRRSREAALRVARPVARPPGDARSRHAVQFRLHRRHDRRELRQPRHQP